MDKRIGILGGGQLGRMMTAAGSLLNLDITILDVGEDSPAKQIYARQGGRAHLNGSFSDAAQVRALASQVDVLTVEIEHVNAEVLAEIERSNTHVQVHPSSSTLKIIQDKLVQKNHLRSRGLPVPDYVQLQTSTPESVADAVNTLGIPLMLKSRTQAYDGKGNYALKDQSESEAAIRALGPNRALYAERWASFEREIAVMVVRSASGEVRSYPAVETVHQDSICLLVLAPLRSPNPDVPRRARELAEKAVATFTGAGVFGVELFLMSDGELLINEIAPRPHNSGHYTIEACQTSQYENHLRAILDLPLGSTEMKVPSSIMLNLLGASDDMGQIENVTKAALSVPGASIHLYGKKACRKGRKMGHITLVGKSDTAVHSHLRTLMLRLPSSPYDLIERFASERPGPSRDHPRPLVAIIMGSDSDLPVMKPAAAVLEDFGIPYELTIVSAHRTPDRMVNFARSAASRGLRVVIAGAGGAAHLPGMVAALTSLPVIGVPVKGSSLDGVDSLHSIVQMPRGIPVATVAINNSMNAGLLAVRILASADSTLLASMDSYLNGLESQVMGKVDELGRVGWDQYVVKK